MSTKQTRTRIMAQSCGSRDLVKQNRSIDLVTGFLIAIFNIAEIVMIAKIKRKKRIYETILMSLSVSDCMFGLSNVLVSSIFLSQTCNHNLSGSVYVFYVFFVMASIFHLLFIAIDRVMIVLIPIRYKTILTKKRLRIYIAVLWVLPLVIGITSYLTHELTTPEPLFTGLSNSSTTNEPFIRTDNHSIANFDPLVTRLNNSNTRNKSLIATPGTRCLVLRKHRFQPNAQLVLSIVIVTLDLLMIFCYSAIIYRMSFMNERKLARKSKKEHRLPVLCVIIAGVFVIFTLPYAITRFYLGYVPFWANYILILNSGMNSIVYFFRQRIEEYHIRETANTQQINTIKSTCENLFQGNQQIHHSNTNKSNKVSESSLASKLLERS